MCCQKKKQLPIFRVGLVDVCWRVLDWCFITDYVYILRWCINTTVTRPWLTKCTCSTRPWLNSISSCYNNVARKHTLRLASLYTILLKRRWQNGLFSINLVRAAVEICGQSLTLSHISLGQVSSKTSNAWSDNEVQYASPSRSISSQLLAIAVMVRSVTCLQNRSSNTLSLFMEARIKSASTASLHLPLFVFCFCFWKQRGRSVGIELTRMDVRVEYKLYINIINMNVYIREYILLRIYKYHAVF